MKYLNLTNGLATLTSAITASLGLGSAGKIIATNADGLLDVSFFPRLAIRTISTNANIVLNDFVIVVIQSCNITLPTAVGISGKYFIIKYTGTSGNLNILTTSSQLIDNDSTLTLTKTNSSVTLISNGTKWLIT